jgi:hypothetical protein
LSRTRFDLPWVICYSACELVRQPLDRQGESSQTLPPAKEDGTQPKDKQKGALSGVMGCLGLLGVLAALGVIFGMIVVGADIVGGAAQGFLGGILSGIIEALDRADLYTWYFVQEARIEIDHALCSGPQRFVVSCRNANLAAVNTWNEIMHHGAARTILAFAFPIVFTLVVKKIIDEIWDGEKKK